MSMTVPDLDLTTTQINSMYAYDENRMEDFIMFEAGLEVRLLFVDGHIGKHHFVFYCVPNCPYLKVVQGHFPTYTHQVMKYLKL